MALFALGRALALGLVAPLTLDMEGVVLLGGGRIAGGRIHTVALEATLYFILAGSFMVALETIDGPGVLAVVKSYGRFLGGGLVNGNRCWWISSDSH